MRLAFLTLLLGHTVYSVLTHRNSEEESPPPQRGAAFHFFDVVSLWNFAIDNPTVAARFLIVAVAEELIWRAAAQPLLIELTGSVLAGIVIVAAGFSIVHKHFFRNEVAVSAEFLAFALLLGALYYLTGSLILVVVIHAVRDIEIAYIEYLIKVETLGDKTLAARDVEQAYTRRSPAQRVPLPVVFLAQTPLFALACYFGARQEVFSRQLVSPLYIGLGLVVGHLIFGVSLLVTHRSL